MSANPCACPLVRLVCVRLFAINRQQSAEHTHARSNWTHARQLCCVYNAQFVLLVIFTRAYESWDFFFHLKSQLYERNKYVAYRKGSELSGFLKSRDFVNWLEDLLVLATNRAL
jgi:hypothetical protein